MPLNANQVTAFFRDIDQMGLSAQTRIYIQGEGILIPDDLIDFTRKDSWDQIVDKCKLPTRIPYPANVGQFIAQETFHLPPKSLMRLNMSAKAVGYYSKTDRPLTAPGITYEQRLNNFKAEWDSLQERKAANNDSALPIISKNFPITQWFEAHKAFNFNYIGQSGCPLSWIFRDNVAVSVAETLTANQPYSAVHGSVKEEMVQRLTHTRPHYRADNATGYAHLVTKTFGTQYASTLAPFKQAKDGRGTKIALEAQSAGPAHWDAEAKKVNDFMMNHQFTGQGGQCLHSFTGQHRASFHTLQLCADDMQLELTNDRMRVGWSINNMKECMDKYVSEDLAAIRMDDGAAGMRSDFERSVAFLLPTDPIKKNQRSKRRAATISSVVASCCHKNGGKRTKGSKGTKGVKFKVSKGSTGVELRYYKLPEFKLLLEAQEDELKAHINSNGNYKGAWSGKSGGKHEPGNYGGSKGRYLNKAQVDVLLREHDAEKEKAETEKEEIMNEIRGEISAMMRQPNKGTAISGSAARSVNPAEVGAASAANAADAEDNAAAEAAAAAIIDKFGSKFSAIGSKSKKATGLTPALSPHWTGLSANGELKVVQNLYLCARISVIWATTTSVEDKNDEMNSTQLDSHANMAVVCRHSIVINRSGKSADVRPIYNDCSQMTVVPIVNAAVAYD